MVHAEAVEPRPKTRRFEVFEMRCDSKVFRFVDRKYEEQELGIAESVTTRRIASGSNSVNNNKFLETSTLVASDDR